VHIIFDRVVFLKVEWYFRLMFLLLVISISSFSLLNYSNTAINARKTKAISSSNFLKKKKKSSNTIDPFDFKNDESLNASKNELIQDLEPEFSPTKSHQEKENRKEKIILLSFIFCLSFM